MNIGGIFKKLKRTPDAQRAPQMPALQVNWRNRYSRIINENDDLLNPKESVLEVGSGNIGIGPYLQRRVVGLEPNFDGPTHEYLEPHIGSIFAIPFPDDYFDIVLCVDVMEHLEEHTRQAALRELLRCARKKLIISCPCGLKAEEAEKHLAQTLRQYGINIPAWLQEHMSNGLPTVKAIFDTIITTKFPFRLAGNESLNQHLGGILLDIFLPFSQELAEKQAAKSPRSAPLSAVEWDSYYSYSFTIYKSLPPTSISSPRPSYVSSINSDAIYAVYHKAWPTEHLGAITPLYVGTAAKAAGTGDLTDVLSDGRILDNARWSELSAFYKIWKEGPTADVVGFCHYRRLYDIEDTKSSSRFRVIDKENLLASKDWFYDKGHIEKARSGHIILVKPFDLVFQSIWDQYDADHNIQDYCKIISHISQDYRDLLPFVSEQFESKKLYATNMIIASWANFDELCGILFPLLFSFENAVVKSEGNSYQCRDLSFLSERIFDLWIRSKIAKGVEIIEMPMFFVKEAGIDHLDQGGNGA